MVSRRRTTVGLPALSPSRRRRSTQDTGISPLALMELLRRNRLARISKEAAATLQKPPPLHAQQQQDLALAQLSRPQITPEEPGGLFPSINLPGLPSGPHLLNKAIDFVPGPNFSIGSAALEGLRNVEEPLSAAGQLTATDPFFGILGLRQLPGIPGITRDPEVQPKVRRDLDSYSVEIKASVKFVAIFNPSNKSVRRRTRYSAKRLVHSG